VCAHGNVHAGLDVPRRRRARVERGRGRAYERSGVAGLDWLTLAVVRGGSGGAVVDGGVALKLHCNGHVSRSRRRVRERAR
jgi:hypothetical protein